MPPTRRDLELRKSEFKFMPEMGSDLLEAKICRGLYLRRWILIVLALKPGW